MGLMFVDTRSITPDELNRCASEVNKIELRLKRQGWLFGLFAAITALVSLQFVFEILRAKGGDLLLTVLSIVAIGLVPGGVAGSAGEVVFGSRLRRILFASALAGLGISLLFDGAWTEVLGGRSVVIALIGGNAMLLRQIQERWHTRRFVRSLRHDLLDGLVWHFEREFPTGDEKLPVTRHTADVLPASKIALAIDDKAPEDLRILNVTEVGAGGTGSMDAPLDAFEPGAGLESFNLRQRQFTPEEKTELARLLRRDLRALLMRGLITFWAVTAFVGGMDAFVNKHPGELTAKSVLAGALIVIGLLGRHVVLLQRIRTDLRDGLVIVIRSKDPALEEIAVERLARSGIAWSEFGAPSPWRTKQRPR